MRINGEQARARARATLGRDPQDRYEAAIALESSGVIGSTAIQLGQQAAHLADVDDRRPLPGGPDRHRLSWNSPTSVGLLLVALLWASMATTGGTDHGPSGVLLGLPLGLSLVGYLDRRYLTGEDGPRQVRSNAGPILLTVGVPCTVLALAAPGGVVGVGVVLMLLCSTLAARLGQAGAFIAIMALAFVASRSGLPSDTMAAISLGLVLVLVLVDLARLPRSTAPPARLGFGLTRGLAGLGLGLLTAPVLAHASVQLTTPAMIVVVPSALGGALAATVLHRMWIEIPDLLDSLPAGPRPDRAVGAVYTRLVALGLLVGIATTAGLSALVVVLAPMYDRPRVISVLIAMAAITVVAYSASVLQAMGAESPVAAGLVACGCLAIGATILGGHVATVDVALVVAVHIMWLPLLVHLFRDPERALAARL